MKKAKILGIIIVQILLVIIPASLASALTITSVSSNPTEVSPGGKVSLEMMVENNLNDDITDVIISLDLTNVPFAPYQSSSEERIGDLDEDDEEKIGFELIADSNAESGTYKIPVKISYSLNNEEKESSGLVSLIINAEPKLDIILEDFVLIRGRNNDLNIRIINSGLGNAKFLNVKVQEVSGLKLLSTNSIYLGNLDSDDFDTAKFDAFINENANIINLPVTLIYTDARNNQVNENLNLQLKTYTTKQAVDLGLIKKSNTTTIIISAVVLIILFFIYRAIRRRLKKKKLERE